MLDIIIKNGTIVDGTGEKRFKADIGIKEDKIMFVGDCNQEANEVIDADGLIVSPGFIDYHSHSDMNLLIDGRAMNMLLQGVTTEISGHCGMTLFPAVEDIFSFLKPYMSDEQYNKSFEMSQTLNDFINEINKKELGTNCAFYIGHGSVRAKVMGYENRKPTEDELNKMKSIVREAMEAGAVGLTTGLIYPPGVYANEDEIVELCKVVAEFGGSYATHMRSEGNWLLESMKEAIRIGERSGVPVVISHHKVAGKHNWGNSIKSLKLIEEANAKGIKVRADQYPYPAGATDLLSALPPKYAVDGPAAYVEKLKDKKVREDIKSILASDKADFENLIYGSGLDGVLIIGANKIKEVIGKTIAQLAKEQNKDPYDVIFDLLIEDEGGIGCAYFMMGNEDIERIMAHPLVMGGCDASHSFEDFPAGHPRYTGTFVKILSEYVRDKNICELEEAIRKLSNMPAEMARLETKGLIKENYDADIVIFDYNKLKANSDFTKPSAPNEGIKYVIVNGEITVNNDNITGKFNGKVLRIK